MQAFWVEKLFDGRCFQFNAEVVIESGVIRSVQPIVGQSELPRLRGLLVPGFIDLQVNGGGGALFCQNPSRDTLAIMVKVHRHYGTTRLLPTLITSEFKVMKRAADAVAEYLTKGKIGVLGVHFEGPHLSAERAGIHAKAKLQALSDKHLALYTRQDLGQVMITLAPEAVDSDVIADLTRQGVIVSLGHSNADSDCVEQAIAAGAVSVTHLYNAMSPLVGREPGMVGAALASDSVCAGIIVDGFHVHPTSVRAAVYALGPERVYLVTDAMGHVGCPVATLPYEDTAITNRAGRLTLPDGTLAGSALTMVEAVLNCHRTVGIALPQCLQMASATPAAILGQSTLGRIKPGFQADLVLLNDEFQVAATWVQGQYQKVS